MIFVRVAYMLLSLLAWLDTKTRAETDLIRTIHDLRQQKKKIMATKNIDGRTEEGGAERVQNRDKNRFIEESGFRYARGCCVTAANFPVFAFVIKLGMRGQVSIGLWNACKI